MIKLVLFIFLVLSTSSAFSQDIAYAKKVIDTLTSKVFWGRGYTNNGMGKASLYLQNQFKLIGLKPLENETFLQNFSYPVNTFPGKMEVKINGKKLRPGRDFIVSPESRGSKKAGKLLPVDSTEFVDASNRVALSLMNKLTWSVAPQSTGLTTILVRKNALIDQPRTYNINIENKQVQQFKASNVAGFISGTVQPDSFIVFTAHYDHLGGLGKHTYFPGANDNASGVSLLLDLARYYADNPARYSVAFICFAGEEAGLKGSKFFTENPLVPLNKIRFLLNVDLVGTGEDGITVVNATEFPNEFQLLNNVNNSRSYVNNISARGKAANSDHYWFTEKGVPAFFIYTLGGITAYHDVFDKASTLPLTEYEDLFKLIVGFNNELMR